MRCNAVGLIVLQVTASHDTSLFQIASVCDSHIALSNTCSNRITFDSQPLSFLDGLVPRMLLPLLEG